MLMSPTLDLQMQDTGAVLEDVRKIIAEQLGTDEDKVRHKFVFILLTSCFFQMKASLPYFFALRH